MTTEAETNDQKSGAKPRYDQRIVRLYRVNLRGFYGLPVRSSYVVADNPDEACRCVRDELDRRDYGFAKDRELESIELIAESKQHTDTPAELFLPNSRINAE